MMSATRLYLSILVLVCVSVASAHADVGFDKYKIILDREPFGEAPAPEAAALETPAPTTWNGNVVWCDTTPSETRYTSPVEPAGNEKADISSYHEDIAVGEVE